MLVQMAKQIVFSAAAKKKNARNLLGENGSWHFCG